MDFGIINEIINDYGFLFVEGIKLTLLLAFSGTIIGLIIGLIVGGIKAIKVEPRDSLPVRILKRIVSFLLSVYIEFFRGTPMMVQSIFLFYSLRHIFHWTPIVAGIFIISINTGAYMAEIVRSGIQSVDKGQMEGARSIGMTSIQTMIYIIIPQAIKNSFPSIINEFITNIKDSSVLNVIQINELFFQGKAAAGSNYKYAETYFIIALIYLCLTFPTSKFLGYIEKRMNQPKKAVNVKGN